MSQAVSLRGLLIFQAVGLEILTRAGLWAVEVGGDYIELERLGRKDRSPEFREMLFCSANGQDFGVG